MKMTLLLKLKGKMEFIIAHQLKNVYFFQTLLSLKSDCLLKPMKSYNSCQHGSGLAEITYTSGSKSVSHLQQQPGLGTC